MTGKTHHQPVPFEDAGATIAGLEIDSAQDRIAVSGSIDIPRDKTGLEKARDLAEYFDAVARQMEHDLDAGSLPDKVKIDAPVMKDNPFQAP